MLRHVLVWCLLLSFDLTRIHAGYAHKRRTSTKSQRTTTNNNEYDKSITTFDENGRLRQVEYGRTASMRGSCVACACFDVPTSPRPVTTEEDGTNTVNCGSLTEETIRRTIVIACARDSKDSSGLNATTQRTHKVHRIDTNILLVTTGLNGDGWALADTLRRMALNKRLTYGEVSPNDSEKDPTTIIRNGGDAMGDSVGVRTIARECASLQHQLTWTPGARPLGVTATLIGTDPNGSRPSEVTSDSLSSSMLKLYQCDLAGEAEEYECCVTGRESVTAQPRLLQLLEELKRERDTMGHTSQEEDAIRNKLIEGVARISMGLTHTQTEETLDKEDLQRTVGEGKDQNQNQNSIDTYQTVDIYVVESHVHYRGGVRIRRAEFVRNKDLRHVSSLFGV